MAVYSIKDLEKISGIKAHTLRMWEHRYGLLKARRTETNIRYYDDEDVRLLLAISWLKQRGWRISRIAALGREGIEREAASGQVPLSGEDARLDMLSLAMAALDARQVDYLLDLMARDDFEQTMLEVVYPFLERLSLLWMTGAVEQVQEMFVVQVVRRKLMAAIDALPLPPAEAEEVLLFLPEGETQELVLLFVQFLLRKRGWNTLYLGAEVRLDDLRVVARLRKVPWVFTLVNEPLRGHSFQAWVEELSGLFGESHLLLAGYQAATQTLSFSPRVHLLPSLGELMAFVEETMPSLVQARQDA